MIPTTIYLINASINENGKLKEYIAIENENGILLVDENLFVISFNNKIEIPYYEILKELNYL